MQVSRPLLEQHLKLAPASQADRIHTLRKLFQAGGCPQILEQQVPDEQFPNLICVLPGTEEGTILLSASSDDVQDRSSGDWGALAMLALAAESLDNVPHRYTLMLAAFTGRANGNRGALWYLDHLTESQRKSVLAAINIDGSGNAPAAYAVAKSDRALSVWLEVAANSLHLPNLPQVEKDGPIWNAAEPFASHRIPTLVLRSPPAEISPPATIQVTGAPASPSPGLDTYEETYRRLCVFALYLDRNLGSPLILPGTYTGRIIDTAGVFTESQIDAIVDFTRFTSSNELYRYEMILQKNGQEGLADALHDEADKGTLRFGVQIATAIKMVVRQETKAKKPYLLVVVPRSSRKGGTVRDFRFTVLRLDLDGSGEGTGQFYSTARLRIKNHELEIDEFGSTPDLIQQVRLQPPPAEPIARPATIEVATKTPPALSPAVAAPATQSATASPQQKPTAPPSAPPVDAGVTPTFRSQARLVQVDVAVIDSHGKPIQGLQTSDFTVFEDGKPQPIRAFEAHVLVPKADSVPATVKSTLPPDTFTNRAAIPEDQPLSILLLDLLNTPLTDQEFARQQVIEFLKASPPRARMAMFVLSGKLVLVQDFASDPQALLAAAQKVMSDRSLLLTTEAERQEFQGNAEALATIAGPGGAPAGSSTGGFGFAQQRERSNAMMEADRLSQRVVFTLDSLTAMSHSVSGYPGRKNLVWLSGSFPIRLKSAIDFNRLNDSRGADSTGFVSTPDFEREVRATTTALAAARIAVYPIDVRGIQVGGVAISVSASESASFSGTGNPGAYSDNLNAQSETRFQEHSSMTEVAEQTGGEVLTGNNIRDLIARGISDGSTYYTLAYTPVRSDSDPGFRKIEIKTNRGGLHLSYRPGYFPSSNQDNPAQKSHPLVVAMQPGMPNSTIIPLTVQVTPPGSANKKTQITYTIDIAGIDFAEAPGPTRSAVFDCIAVAFGKDGKPAGQASNGIEARLTPAQYEATMHSGLQVRQEIDLPPGQYDLRLGVMDKASLKIGTLVVPLAVAAVSPTK